MLSKVQWSLELWNVEWLQRMKPDENLTLTLKIALYVPNAYPNCKVKFFYALHEDVWGIGGVALLIRNTT